MNRMPIASRDKMNPLMTLFSRSKNKVRLACLPSVSGLPLNPRKTRRRTTTTIEIPIEINDRIGWVIGCRSIVCPVCDVIVLRYQSDVGLWKTTQLLAVTPTIEIDPTTFVIIRRYNWGPVVVQIPLQESAKRHSNVPQHAIAAIAFCHC